MRGLQDYASSQVASLTTTNRFENLRYEDANSVSSPPLFRTPTPTSNRSYADAAGGSSTTTTLPSFSARIKQSAVEQHKLARQYEVDRRDDQQKIRQLESQNVS